VAVYKYKQLVEILAEEFANDDVRDGRNARATSGMRRPRRGSTKIWPAPAGDRTLSGDRGQGDSL
jgi:hypothetical protein